jgi:uncharacterized membrane protein YccF (DUF307 family)
MSLVGNILWILLGGWIIFCEYLIAGLFLSLTVIGIPFGLQCFKLALFSLVPFGKRAIAIPQSHPMLSVFGNVFWILLFGLWIALTHTVCGLLCACTILGIPFAVQHWKLAGMALYPFGRTIEDIPTIAV